MRRMNDVAAAATDVRKESHINQQRKMYLEVRPCYSVANLHDKRLGRSNKISY